MTIDQVLNFYSGTFRATAKSIRANAQPETDEADQASARAFDAAAATIERREHLL